MRVLVTAIFICVTALGCNLKKDPTATPAEESDEPDAGDDDTDTTSEKEPASVDKLVFEPLQEDAMVGTLASALVSVAETKDKNGASLNPGTLAIMALVTTETCKASGSPNTSESDNLSAAQNAALSAYCDLSKHPDGPDTTLGGIDRIQGMLCALAPISYDGKERDIEMKLTTKCFSSTFVDMAKSQICGEGSDSCPGGVPTLTHTVKSSKIASSAAQGVVAYDRLIEISVPEGKEGFAYKIKLLQTAELLSAEVYEPEETNGTTVFAVSLSTAEPAAIRYEGRFSKSSDNLSDANSNWKRHLRVFATGSLDAKTKAFKEVKDVQYLHWDLYPTSGGDSLLTVKGSPTDGFRAVAVGSTPAFDLANYLPTAEQTLCYGTGPCTGNEGILVKATKDFDFMKSLNADDPSYITPADWFANHGPLKFESVTFAVEPD